ncbi:MAG: hypothetical protein NVSMB19_02440 [Vulcanimicrobiaceae bacterium]
MRLARVFAVSLAAVATAVTAASARGSESRVDIRGDTVGFFPYSNQTLVAADGHVVVRVGPRTIEARAVRYDILAKRLTAAGDVRVRGRGDDLHGAAYRLELDSDRAFLLQDDPLPATFALDGDDLAAAVEGPAPAGTFETVDLDGQRPYIRSRHAVVVPSSGVRMTPAEFPTSTGLALALPTYLYTLVANQNIAQTAGPGASFDQPYNLFGSTNSLTAAHVRYEAQSGVTVAVDTRLVDRDRAYAVTSFSPLRNRRADLVAFQQLRPGLQQTLSATHTLTLYPATIVQYRLQQTGRSSSVSLTANQFNTANGIELGASTIPHDVGRYFSYQLRTAYGYDHSLFGYPYANDFHTSVGGYVTPPGVTLAGTNLNARYDYALTAYDYPHQASSGTLTLSGGRRFPRGVGLYATVAFAQIANRYRDAAIASRALRLPDPRLPYFAPDGTPFPGYFAFAGLSTFRTYELQATFAGRSGEDRTQLTVTHTRDFPQSFGYGRPPLTARIDVTRRLTRTIRLEIGRAYTFGYGGRYLSPQYTFGISP